MNSLTTNFADTSILLALSVCRLGISQRGSIEAPSVTRCDDECRRVFLPHWRSFTWIPSGLFQKNDFVMETSQSFLRCQIFFNINVPKNSYLSKGKSQFLLIYFYIIDKALGFKSKWYNFRNIVDQIILDCLSDKFLLTEKSILKIPLHEREGVCVIF